MTEKNITKSKNTEDKLDALVLIKIWLDGWKKTFTLKGRSSRFELWTFILLNSILTIIVQLRCSYIMSERFITDAHAQGYSISQIENNIAFAEIFFLIAILVPLFPLFSMLIRRMHDIGELAWHSNLEPVFMASTTIGILGYTYLTLNINHAYIAMIISIFIITLFYSVLFYSTKFLIKTLFYRGDTKKNEYGKAQFKDTLHEEQALNFACIYILFAITIASLYIVVSLI